MTATSQRIGFILEEFRIVTSENSTTLVRYGNAARRDIEPRPTFFDDTDDAETIADERLALLGVARRRFSVNVAELDVALALPRGAVVQYVDEGKGVDQPMLVSEIAFDFGNQTATLELWG